MKATIIILLALLTSCRSAGLVERPGLPSAQAPKVLTPYQVRNVRILIFFGLGVIYVVTEHYDPKP